MYPVNNDHSIFKFFPGLFSVPIFSLVLTRGKCSFYLSLLTAPRKQMQQIFINILIGFLIRGGQIYHYMGTFQKIRQMIKNLFDWSFKAWIVNLHFLLFLILKFCLIICRGLRRDVVSLGSIAPSFMSPNAGGEGGGSWGVSANECTYTWETK